MANKKAKTDNKNLITGICAALVVVVVIVIKNFDIQRLSAKADSRLIIYFVCYQARLFDKFIKERASIFSSPRFMSKANLLNQSITTGKRISSFFL